MYTDLHLHSYYSDGTNSPEDIVLEAKKAGVSTIAICDHNTCNSYGEFTAACEKHNITGIKGMELDCRYKNHILHVLAYEFKETKEILKIANKSREIYLEMSRDVIKTMEDDYPNISLEEYDKWEYDRTKGGWKGLHYFVKKKLAQELWDGTKFYKMYGCDYLTYPFPSVERVCKVIKEAGGVPVLAHPCNYFKRMDKARLYQHLEELHSIGIAGIECYYPANTTEMTENCVEFCKEKNLAITSGSDSHGDFIKVQKGVSFYIGAVNVASDLLDLKKIFEKRGEKL